MPLPVDLTGQVFGLLTALHLDKTKTAETGRRHWRCRCRCGELISVDANALRSGNTRSCGCLRKKAIKKLRHKQFKGNEVTNAFREKERITRFGKDYLRTGKAMRLLSVSKPTLVKWADPKQACPWLDGRTIRSVEDHIDAFNRDLTYYLEEDLIHVRDAMRTRTVSEEHFGFTLVDKVMKEVGVTRNTLVKACMAQSPAVRISLKPAKRKDGQACKRAYVPTAFFELLRAKQKEHATPQGTVTTADAARQLDRTTTTIRTYVQDGRLVGRSERRPTGLTKHMREEILITQDSIDRLKRMLRGESISPDAPGQQTGQQCERSTRGRRAHDITIQRNKACYEAYSRVRRGEQKMAIAMREIREIYGLIAPKEDSHLRLYAKRYAEKGAKSPLPWPPPDTSKNT